MRDLFRSAVISRFASSLPLGVTRVARMLVLTVVAMFAIRSAAAQGTFLADPAGARVIVASKGSPQFYVLNADESLLGYSTLNSSSYTLSCGTPSGLAATDGGSFTLASDERQETVFQTGAGTSGNASTVGRGVPLSGSTCKDSSASSLGGGAATTAALSAQDAAHQRLFVVSNGTAGAADTITSYSTANVQFYGNVTPALSQLAQANLDSGGTYTAVVTDVDGTYGDTIVTQLRDDTHAGGVWLFNSSFNAVTRVLGPGGVALPAIGAFILHNPNDGGGGLLVVVNQDGLTSSNLSSPPVDATAFTLIDLGQLHSLVTMNNSPATITLPAVTTIGSQLGYYAMLGAAYNPVNHLLYALVGGATLKGDIYRTVVSYDPSTPAAPAETVVAFATAIPVTSSQGTQIALNAASGTMQVLDKSGRTVYTLPITGTGNIASVVEANTFPDSAFQPTYVAANPWLGETYIASSGQVDILTRPTGTPMQLELDLTAPETQTTAGDDSAVQLLVSAPDPFDFGLSSRNVTIMATPQDGSAPFTFASETAALATGLPASITGNFPNTGIYTLVATFPGDSVFAAATSSPVTVAVGTPLFATQTGLAGSFNSSTGQGNAMVTLSGTTYTPSGTVKLISVTSGLTLATLTLQAQAFTNPIAISFTAPPSTVSFKAVYSGDSLNQASSSAETILTTATQTKPTLLVTTPNSATVGAAAHLGVFFQTTSTTTPTGNITLSATSTAVPFTYIGSVTAAQAFATGGTTIDWTPATAGTYSISANYNGDANYGAASGSNPLTVTAPTPITFRLTAPATVSQNTAFNVGVYASPVGATPTGNITITAVNANSTSQITLGTVSASAAAGTSGTTLTAQIAGNGAYTLMGSYAGDGTYAAAAGNNTPEVTVVNGGAATVLITPASGTFAAPAGTSSPYQTFTLYNTGGNSLTITSIGATGSGFAEIDSCSSPIASGGNCVIRVNFSPATAGPSLGAILVTDNASGSPQTISLSGTGTASLVVLTPGTATFIDQTVGTTSNARPIIRLQNNGTAPFTVTAETLSNTTDFELIANNCQAGAIVTAGSSCTAQLVFHPGAPGAKAATASFTTSGSTQALTLTATGTGLAAGGCVDTDGDSLCDDWEQNGVWVRVAGKPDQFIDLPAMGADYKHKDIFIQADYMATGQLTTGEHSHQMKLDALKIDIASFANAPVSNPDGKTGIHLHVDCGYNCIMDPVKGTIWGNASLASEIVEQNVLDSAPFDKTVPFDWTIFDSDSTAFLQTGRSLVFHHVLFAHDQNPGYGSSGISRNASTFPDFLKGASDLIVSMGSWTDSVGTAMEQAGTLMHELGHNLGLQHGGGTSNNYLPNYLSVMNYYFQVVGLTVNGKSGTFDYSRWALPNFDEGLLSEVNGMGINTSLYPAANGVPGIGSYGTAHYCHGADTTKAKPVYEPFVDAPINWDCSTDGVISQKPLSSDVTGDGGVYLYPGFNDWPALVFSGGAVGGNGIGNPAPTQTLADEITQEEQSLQQPPNGVSITGIGGLHTAPGSNPTLTFVVTNTGTSADTFDLSASTLGGWAVAPGVPASIALSGGASTTVSVTYTVPSSAVEGDSDTLVLRAVSEATANVLDSKEVRVYATISPAPVAISAASVNFGTQDVGSTGAAKSVVVMNTGTSSLALGTIATTAEFNATSHCGSMVAVGTSCTVDVTFSPAAEGSRTGTMTIDAGGAVQTVALSGKAVTPELPIPNVTMSATPAQATTGQTVTLSANVSSVPAGTTPTGTVTFFNDTVQIAQAPLDAKGNAVFTSNSLGAGTYSIMATYSGDSGYRASNSPFTALVIVVPTLTTNALTTSAAAIATGSSVTFTATLGGGSAGAEPTGSVTFLDGSTTLGMGTLNASGVAGFSTSSLTTGTHSITAVYAGDAVFGASTSNAVTETIGFFATSTSLAASASTVATGTAVTLTGTVSSASGTPAGSVTFLDGTTTLGTATLNGSGVAAYTTSALAIGTHSITAQYSASGNYSASVSTAKQVVVTGAPDYTIAANPASLSLTAGGSGSAVFTVTPINGYAGTITFSCGTLPSYATCSFAPTKLTFTAGVQTAQSTTLTVGTTDGMASLAPVKLWPESPVAWAMMMPLALLGMRRKRLAGRGALLVLMLAVMSLSGCGGSASQHSTPAGSYTVPITITDGATNHSLTYSVTVK